MGQLQADAGRRMRTAAYGVVDAAFAGRGVPRTVNGERLRFPARWSRYYPSSYEHAKHRFLVEHCRPGTTAVDGGAHIGLFTVAMARAVGPGGWVLAFEPTRRTRAILTRTIALNDLGASVTVRPEGLAATTGRMTLHVGPTEGSNSNSLVGAPSGSSCEEVPTLALDDLLATLPSELSCIKLDIEGAELDALLGAEAVLRQLRPALCIEVHPRILRSAGRDPEQIRDLLLDLGYSLYDGTHGCSPELFAGDELFEFQAAVE
ncbi:MAG: FkbM family methyltransferase [Acidimicrobiales bacterium]